MHQYEEEEEEEETLSQYWYTNKHLQYEDFSDVRHFGKVH